VVNWLVERKASLDAKDRQHRTVVLHAILSQNVALVAKLVQLRTSLSSADKNWGWTPLHYAAYVGSEPMVEMLLARRASPYLVSHKGWTPVRCAEENNAHGCANLLREFMFSEPAQRVLPGVPAGNFESSVWVGTHRAADVRWATERGFHAIVSIYKPGGRDPRHLWLADTNENDRGVEWLSVEVETDDADDSKASWEALLPHVPKIMRFIETALAEKREILVHCESGVSTSAAVVALHMLLKRRIRLKEAMPLMAGIRREICISGSLRNGLEGLQDEIDRRRLDRLDERLRHSSVLSLGF
jgi:hypothetical protein